jgi:hypothetical protein
MSKRARVVLLTALAVVCAVVVYVSWRPRPVAGPLASAAEGEASAASASPRTGARAEPISVPSFTPRNDRRGLVVQDPTAPGYDPAALTMALGVRVSVLFAREQRDPSWAPRVEKYLYRTLESDLHAVLPAAIFTIQTECKMSTCVAQITFPDNLSEVERLAATFASQYSGIGDSVDVKSEGKTMSLEMAISPKNRTPSAMEEKRVANRDAWLANLNATPLDQIPAADKELDSLLRRMPRVQRGEGP